MSHPLAYRNLPQLFLKAREQFLCHFRPILNHFGLTEQQWRILRALGEKEQMEPREIGEHCHILSPSLSGVLARMEEMKLVSRSRIPEDQRRVMVRLTPKSQHMVAELAPLVMAQYKVIEQTWGTELIEQIYDMMDHITEVQKLPITRIPLPEKKDWDSMSFEPGD